MFELEFLKYILLRIKAEKKALSLPKLEVLSKYFSFRPYLLKVLSDPTKIQIILIISQIFIFKAFILTFLTLVRDTVGILC